MFDYVQRLQLALADTARRSAIKIVAGVVLAIGAGFLIAALWTCLADILGLGATYASLIVGALFLVVGGGAFLVASKPRHQMPTGDDLRREVEARVSLATDVAVDRARAEAMRFADMAESKARAAVGSAGLRAARAAAETQQRMHDFADSTAERTGMTEENLHAARESMERARDGATRAANSNAGSMAKLIGAFAVGLTLASRLRGRGDRDH